MLASLAHSRCSSAAAGRRLEDSCGHQHFEVSSFDNCYCYPMIVGSMDFGVFNVVANFKMH